MCMNPAMNERSPLSIFMEDLTATQPCFEVVMDNAKTSMASPPEGASDRMKCEKEDHDVKAKERWNPTLTTKKVPILECNLKMPDKSDLSPRPQSPATRRSRNEWFTLSKTVLAFEENIFLDKRLSYMERENEKGRSPRSRTRKGKSRASRVTKTDIFDFLVSPQKKRTSLPIIPTSDLNATWDALNEHNSEPFMTSSSRTTKQDTRNATWCSSTSDMPVSCPMRYESSEDVKSLL